YRERLDYKESAVAFSVNQLLGREWGLGVRYRLLYSRLNDRFPDIPASLPTDGRFLPAQDIRARLHEIDLNALWNHQSGFFSGFQAAFYSQHNGGYAQPLADSAFWQLNASAGYRFW